jgi:hypothetical protein
MMATVGFQSPLFLRDGIGSERKYTRELTHRTLLF